MTTGAEGAATGQGTPWGIIYQIFGDFVAAGGISGPTSAEKFRRRFTGEYRKAIDQFYGGSFNKAFKEKTGKSFKDTTIAERMAILNAWDADWASKYPPNPSANDVSIAGPFTKAFNAMLGTDTLEGSAEILGQDIPPILDPNRPGFKPGTLELAEGYEIEPGGLIPQPKAPADWEGRTPQQRKSYAKRVGWDVTDAAIKSLIGGAPGGTVTPRSDPTNPDFTGPQQGTGQTGGVPDGTGTQQTGGVPDGTGTQAGGNTVSTGFNWKDFIKDYGPLIGGGLDLLGGGIAAYGSVAGAEDFADSITEQGQRQDKLSRDVLETGVEYSSEIVDIGLGLGEPFRAAGIGALAGMSDMLGMDRQAFGEFMGLPPEPKFESTGRMNEAGTREFGYKAGEYGYQNQGGRFTAAEHREPKSGESLYQAEYDYDRQRIDKGTQIYYDAPKFDWQEPLKEAGFSFEQGGIAGWQSIYNNLSVIAGFGPQQAPDGAGGAAGIANAGNSLVGSQNYISGAGSALAQGKTGAYNAVGGGFSGMFGNMGWSQGG